MLEAGNETLFASVLPCIFKFSPFALHNPPFPSRVQHLEAIQLVQWPWLLSWQDQKPNCLSLLKRLVWKSLDYRVQNLSVIGHGSFGIIRKVRQKSDGRVRNFVYPTFKHSKLTAAKILVRKEISYIKMSVKEREQLQAEFTILSSLKHPNIVEYVKREHLKPTQELYIYMEYCSGGDLGAVIRGFKAKGEHPSEDYVWKIFSQLIEALYRCHTGRDAPQAGKVGQETALKPKTQSVMILHRDLKPENSQYIYFSLRHILTFGSLPWRKACCQTWRFWSLEADGLARFCFDLCRNTLLYVTRNLQLREIYLAL